MVHARQPSIHPVIVESVPDRNERDGHDGKYMDVLERMVDLLRFSRIRLTVLRVCVGGCGCGFAERLVHRSVGHLGYAGLLGNGDIIFVHVASFGVDDEDAYDFAIERELISLLSTHLAELSTDGPRVMVQVSVAHMWSDEIGDARGFMALLPRLASETDLSEQHRSPAARDIHAPQPVFEAAPEAIVA